MREMIYAYGLVPGLCMEKVGTLVSVALITMVAHRRKWIRPIILALSVGYVTLALVPWA